MGTSDSSRADLIEQALRSPSTAIGYTISRQLADLDSDRALLEGDSHSFDLGQYVAAGLCSIEKKPRIHSQIATGWQGPGQGLGHHPLNTWYEVSWQGHQLDVLLMSWIEGLQPVQRYWIMAAAREIAERFYEEVCEWCAEVRGEVLVYDGGWWNKSADLFQAIQSATFDSLVLQGTMKEDLQADLDHYFASRQLYERYRIPWKRGILFIGPPGNGKTHAVKALINRMGQPCLYVKSFKSECKTDHDCLRDVFRRARQTTPCILVMEDLDSLVDEENRSFFLNELDGFAANAGIVTLATSNHPERLDPSIVDRPSRFDRKYHFELPAAAERLAYVRLWNHTLEPELRVPESAIEEIIQLTEEFSFAYIKELFLSSMMRWIAAREPGGMAGIMASQAAALREQMSSAHELSVENVDVDPAQLARQAMRSMMQRRWRGMPRGW